MENPGKLLRRAQRSRHFISAFNPQKEQPDMQVLQGDKEMHCSSHANYTALMRSHDRVRTRHIGGQSGGSGA